MTIGAGVADFLAQADDPSEGGLIRNGRYQIVPPVGGKATPRTRMTNFAKTLEDTYLLNAHQQRMVLLGTVHRPDIQIAAVACTPEERKELNELCEKAKDAAKANAKRDTGSALHRLTERHDRGETFRIPAPWDADVAAYAAALDTYHIQILGEHIEQVVCNERLNLAGRFDRIVVDGDGERVMFDLKTGSNLSYSWGSIAVQLALYAGADSIYDHATATHQPMPAVNQDYGIVAHLPSEAATCTLYTVDLAAGRRGIEIIEAVNGYRRSTRDVSCLLSSWEVPALSVVPEPVDLLAGL